MRTEAQLLSALATASTFAEQTALVAELDQVRATKAADLADERALQMSASLVEQTLTPVRVHERHTAATDWLGTVEAAQHEDVQQRVIAEASLWYSALDPAVKADRDEFGEQARGMARRTASLIGGQVDADVPALAEGFLQYVAFLNREAASGLPQVDQLVSPDGSRYERTPLPLETYDTFQPPISAENQGVDEMQSTENAEVFQEKVRSGEGGSGAPEVGDYHGNTPVSPAQDDDLEGGMGPLEGTGVTGSRRVQVWEEDPIGRPSLAVNAAFNLDDFKAAEAVRAAQPQVQRQPRQARRQRRVVAEVEKEGSSQLPQVEQVWDADGNYAPTSLPDDVAFPLTGPFAEEHDTSEVPGYPDGGMSSARGRSQAGGQNDARLSSLHEAKSSCSCSCGCSNKADGTCSSCKQGSHTCACGCGCAKGSSGGKCTSCKSGKHQSKSSARKTADMYGNSDAPHQTLSPVQTGPAQVPATGRGFENGYARGAADAGANERPTYSDAGARNEPFQQGYAKGYSENRPGDTFPKDLPYAMQPGIPNNDANAQQATDSEVTATLRRAASKHDQGASDFRKGYAYGRNWKKGTRSVAQGSKEFEAGLYAGMSENPERTRFVVTSLRYGQRFPFLAARVELHRAFTQRMSAHPKSNDYFGDHPDYREPGFPSSITNPRSNLNQPKDDPRQADAEFAKGGVDPRSQHGEHGGVPVGQSYQPAGNEYYSNPGPFLPQHQNKEPYGRHGSKTAATSVDLDTMSPGASADPAGSTPSNGPGTPPPGSSDGLPPGAPGGASPYNGAPPYGEPVAPDPGLDNSRAAAFRRTVQSNLVRLSG